MLKPPGSETLQKFALMIFGKKWGNVFQKNYDSAFLERVYSAPLVSMSDLLEGVTSGGNGGGSIRVLYSTLAEYLRIADYLKIMRDFKVI